MSEEKQYTAQELREEADQFDDSDRPYWFSADDWNKISAMLRQAADAEEELAKVKASKDRWMQYQETAAGERNACIDELREKDAENAQLKARLEAVVKECENIRVRCDKQMMFCHSIYKESILAKKSVANAILRAARGEVGAE